MKYVFHPEAKREFWAALDYYERCEPGLGADFANEVRSTIKNIRNFPHAWPTLADNLRRSQTRRFPYGIIYSVEKGVIYVLAVMHLHRDPNYWQDRRL